MAELSLASDRVVLKSPGPRATTLRPNFPLIDTQDISRLTAEIESCLEEGQPRVVVELTATRALNGELIEALITQNNLLRPRGGWLQLAKLNSVSNAGVPGHIGQRSQAMPPDIPVHRKLGHDLGWQR